MFLRYQADRRVLAWMAIASGLLVFNWTRPSVNPLTLIASCAMAISITTITHNHNHLKIWRSRWLNTLQDYWLTLFYGFPAFVWIPTHNQNHHKFINREGDYTITYRVTEHNTLWALLSYPTLSSYWQQRPINAFLRAAWRNRRPKFLYYVSQYVVLGLWIGTALLIDWRKALLYVVLPQQIGLFAVLVFNYLQHVGADEESEWEHSRDIVSPAMNFFLFNNGYHTVHHNTPGLHWSHLPGEHQKIRHHLNPDLTERSLLLFLFRTYALSPIIPAVKRRNLRLDRLSAQKHPIAPAREDARPAQSAPLDSP